MPWYDLLQSDDEDEIEARVYPRRRDDEVVLDINALVDEVADDILPPVKRYNRRVEVPGVTEWNDSESGILTPPTDIVLASETDVDLLGEIQKNDKTHNWQMDFGSAWAPAGAVSVIRVQPQCYFRVEKVMATDTASTAGMGTEIISVMVGNKLQRVTGNGGTMSLFFSENALGNGVEWDKGDPALDIAITVRWLVACTFYCTVFGTAWRK